MHRAWFPLLAVLVLTSNAAAVAAPPDGEPTVAEVLALLRSDAPKDTAWGAYRAGSRQIEAAGPLVLERLAEHAQRPLKRGAWIVRTSLLDAAIRLRLRVPKDVIVRLAAYHDEITAALVVLDEHTPRETLLAVFDVFDRARLEAEPWLALGNRLHALRAPGFAPRLLKHFRLRRRVRVWDRKGPYDAWRGPGGSVTGCGYAPVPPDFPPFARYRLDVKPGPRYELLVGGTRPVYVTRWEARQERVWFCCVPQGERERSDCRREWLSAWLRLPAGRTRRASREPEGPTLSPGDGLIDIRYTGHQPWARELLAHIRALHEAYWSMARALVARGVLTETEARSLRPAVELTIVDKREDKRHALPELPVVEPQNPWRPRPLPRPRIPGCV